MLVAAGTFARSRQSLSVSAAKASRRNVRKYSLTLANTGGHRGRRLRSRMAISRPPTLLSDALDGYGRGGLLLDHHV